MQKNETKRKQRKAPWILLSILLVLLIAGFALWLWQKNNIDALLMYSQYTQEELEDQLAQNEQKIDQMLQDALEAAGKVDEELKPEEKPEEPPAEEPEEEPETETEEPPAQEPEEEPENQQKPQQPAPQGPSYQDQLQALIDRVYALRAEYVAALESMEKEAVSAYSALPAEKRNTKGKIEFASGYITKATNLEKECDAKMDVIVEELTGLQKAYGQSLELVETVKYTYANEKSLKKAWYMSELERRGMI